MRLVQCKVAQWSSYAMALALWFLWLSDAANPRPLGGAVFLVLSAIYWQWEGECA